MLFAEDFRRIARERLSGKWALAVGTGFVAGLLGAGSRGGNTPDIEWREYSNFLDTGIGRIILPFILGMIALLGMWILITFIFGGAIELGYSRFNVNLIRGDNPQFSDLFSRFSLFWRALGLRIMTFIFTFLWMLLFIIPGIIAAYRYSMAFYIMQEDSSVGIFEAINRSKELMVGNKWRLFCLQISFIGWAILSVLTFGIGFLWLFPYVNAATAAFYLEISRKNEGLEEIVSGF